MGIPRPSQDMILRYLICTMSSNKTVARATDELVLVSQQSSFAPSHSTECPLRDTSSAAKWPRSVWKSMLLKERGIRRCQIHNKISVNERCKTGPAESHWKQGWAFSCVVLAAWLCFQKTSMRWCLRNSGRVRSKWKEPASWYQHAHFIIQ